MNRQSLSERLERDRVFHKAQAILAKPRVGCLVVFIIAFVPRALAAGAYVTVDEEHWVDRSVTFFLNLLNGNFDFIPSVHPGVTSLWGFGSFLYARFAIAGDLASLLQMRAEGHYDLPDLLPSAAMFTALVASLAVVGGYLLLRKLGGGQFAFLAALLLALDPYFLAHSRRVHLDAILASMMYLSALALLVYVGWPETPSPRRYVVLSGVFAGLAWLTKVTAVYLVPFTLLALVGRLFLLRLRDSTNGQRKIGPALWAETRTLLLWLAAAGLVFVLFWPAMWVEPGFALNELVRGVVWGVDQVHTGPGGSGGGPMHFFLGQVVNDPGPGYYPLTLLFRLSPLTFVFFPLSLVAVALAQKRKAIQRPKALAFWLGAAYVLFYGVMLSLSAKKLESYLLPIYPMVDTLAAVGLWAGIRWLARRWQQHRDEKQRPTAQAFLYGLTMTAIIAVSFLWLRLQPHYSAYFNPLLGGPKVAARVYAFGGGEGLDEAARYLNQKANAESLVVATPYDQAVFGYYFDGLTQPPRRKNWTGSWLLADYIISYLSYEQRDLPAPEVLEFLKTLDPEYVVTINGTEYAKIYRVPPLVSDTSPAISHPAEVNLADQVTFLGYDLGPEPVESGGEVEITLYWQRRRPLKANYSVYTRLINGVGHVWGQQDSGPLQGMMPTTLWGEGMVIADVRRLPILPGTPPGVYLVEVGMYDSSTMTPLEPAGAEQELVLGPVEIVRAAAGEPPVPQHRLEGNLGNKVRLLGYDLGGPPKPGQNLHLTLFWEALSSPEKDYTVFVHLVGPDEQIWGQKDSQPVTGYYPTSRWTAGEFVRDQVDLAIGAGAPAGSYRLVVGLYDASSGQRLPVLDGKGKTVGDSIHLGDLKLEQP